MSVVGVGMMMDVIVMSDDVGSSALVGATRDELVKNAVLLMFGNDVNDVNSVFGMGKMLISGEVMVISVVVTLISGVVMLISGVVMLAKEVKFAETVSDVGRGVGVISGVEMLGKDVKFEGAKVSVGRMVKLSVLVALMRVGSAELVSFCPCCPGSVIYGPLVVVELEMGK